MPKPIKVSVITITYNHEKFIKQTLESIVKQKTTFDFELIIADDHSTDGTQGIIREYAKKYPNVVRPILREKNVGAQNNFKDAIEKARGEYIALCEGDDYWTDLNKLQVQSQYLDEKLSYSLVFHPVRVTFENGESDDVIYPSQMKAGDPSIPKLLAENFIQTNSVMYRRQDYSNLPTDILPLDWYLHLYHAQFGRIGFINKVMSVYRRHEGGLWWDSHGNQAEIWKKYGINYLGLFVEILKLYEKKPEYRDIVYSSIIDMFNRLLQVDRENATDLVADAVSKYPGAARFFLKKQNESLELAAAKDRQADIIIKRLSVSLSRAMEDVRNTHMSKSFRLGHLLLHPRRLPWEFKSTTGRGVRGAWAKLDSKKQIQKNKDAYATAIESLKTHKGDTTRPAVILHLFYSDLWPYFMNKLSLIPGGCELFVSLPPERAMFKKVILQTHPNACVVVIPNRGRDVLPFYVIAKELNHKGYVYFLKLHTKKSKHRDDGSSWLTNIADNLLPPDVAVLQKTTKRLNQAKTGIIGPEGEYVSLAVNYDANSRSVRRLMDKFTSEQVREDVDLHRFDYGFFAGTMFWARFDALNIILSSDISIEDFDTERGQIDGTFAHGLERLFCLLPELDGRSICTIGRGGVNDIEYSQGMIPEWSDLHRSKLVEG